MPPARPQLSIVVPVFHNEGSLPETAAALASTARSLVDEQFELVFVDDGSGDRSFDVLVRLSRDPSHHLKIVKLTRNFGSMAAIQAGLAASGGACVGIITADLQDPPELFVEMHRHWREGVKCVLAVRAEREDGLATRIAAAAFYAVLRRYALPGYPRGGFDFCLIDRQVVDTLVAMNEKNTHIMNLIFWLGYPHVMIPYTRRARRSGRSRWTFSKKLKLFVDSFAAFSYAPIRAVTCAGLAMAALAGLYGLFQIYLRLSSGTPVPGFTTTVTLIALTSGIQMTMLGILGEYLWRALDAARGRPPFVVDKIIEPPHA